MVERGLIKFLHQYTYKNIYNKLCVCKNFKSTTKYSYYQQVNAREQVLQNFTRGPTSLSSYQRVSRDYVLRSSMDEDSNYLVERWFKALVATLCHTQKRIAWRCHCPGQSSSATARQSQSSKLSDQSRSLPISPWQVRRQPDRKN